MNRREKLKLKKKQYIIMRSVQMRMPNEVIMNDECDKSLKFVSVTFFFEILSVSTFSHDFL
jgi:hypothetical protein